MNFNKFTQYFSSSRTERYHNATGKSESKTIKLYKANLAISKSFYPLLAILEVLFRNKINDTLSVFFNDAEWIINQKSGFMIDSSLTFTYKKTRKVKTNRFLLEEITKVENKLVKAGVKITSGKIISEQTFGFWTDLFEVHHYKLLKGKPIKIFANLPANYGRKEVNDELKKIRRFRNRIYHNEPICFSGSTVDFTETLDIYNSIRNVLRWIDPQLLEFIADIDEIIKNITIAEKI